MRNRIISLIQYIIFLGGGLFLVWWQLKEMTAEDKNEFYNALTKANYWLLIPIITMSLLSHLSRSLRWKLLMEPMGYKPATKNVFAVTMAGYLANSAVPRLGEVLKCTLLAKYEKFKVEKLVGTILIERTFDMVCYFIFIIITVLIQVNLISGYVKEKFEKVGQSASIPIWLKFLIIIFCVGTIIFLIKFLYKKYPENKLFIKINNFYKGIVEGIATIKNLKQQKLFLAHTVFIWSMYLLQIYVGFQAMEGTAHLGIKEACAVLSLASLAMIATPGGIGSFPFFVMETLTIYGIATSLGKAFGWLIWGASTSIVIVVGLACVLLLPLINKNKYEKH
jgi:glycosyltransferase 2 family protein